ncbi:hypothetical protein BOX15_Mlig018647g1, partial [Macrostomum lignano]
GLPRPSSSCADMQLSRWPLPPPALLLLLLTSLRSNCMVAAAESTAIEFEIAASDAAMSELTAQSGSGGSRSVDQILQLCMRQSPELFCAWFSFRVSRYPTGHSFPNSSSMLSYSDEFLFTCFNEVKFGCNRNAKCAPSRRLVGLDVTHECYCSCAFFGSNKGFNRYFQKQMKRQQLPTNGYSGDIGRVYQCSSLCDHQPVCMNSFDESPAICSIYDRHASSPWSVASLTLGIAAVLVTLSYLLNAVLKGLLMSVCPKWRRLRRLFRRCSPFGRARRSNRSRRDNEGEADEVQADEAEEEEEFDSAEPEPTARRQLEPSMMMPLRLLRPAPVAPPPYEAAVAQSDAASTMIPLAPPPPYTERDQNNDGSSSLVTAGST